MPMLEKYRDYFDIDPDFFPAVNEAVIMKNPEMWKKILSARNLYKAPEEHNQCPRTQAEALPLGGGSLRYG